MYKNPFFQLCVIFRYSHLNSCVWLASGFIGSLKRSISSKKSINGSNCWRKKFPESIFQTLEDSFIPLRPFHYPEDCYKKTVHVLHVEVKDGFHSFKKGLLSWICLLPLSGEWQEPGLAPSWSWITLWAQREVTTKAAGWSRACFVGLGIASPPWCGLYPLHKAGVSIWNLLLTSLLLELLLCKLPFCKALPASMRPDCLWSTPGKPACTQTEGGHKTQASVVWYGGGSLEESKTTPVAQSCSPCVFLGLQGYSLSQLWCVADMVKDCSAFCSEINPWPVAALFLLLYNFILRWSASHSHFLLSYRSFHRPCKKYLA